MLPFLEYKGTLGSRPQDDDDAEARRLRKRIYHRRSFLLCDTREVSDLFAPHLAILAFPAAGKKPILFGNPIVETVLRSFLPAADGFHAGTQTVEQAAARAASMRREAGSRRSRRGCRLRAVAEKVKAAQEVQGREHWWEVDVDTLREEELPEFDTALDVLRAHVLQRLDELAVPAKPPQRQ